MTQLVLTAKRFVGFGKESSFGTEAGSYRWLPVTGPAPEENIVYIEDPGFRSIATTVFDEYQGPKSAKFSYGVDWYPTDTPLLLTSMLGPDTPGTPVSGMTPHVFHLASTLPASLTLRDYDGIDEYEALGCFLDGISFTMDSEGKLTSTVTGMGLNLATQSTDTPVFTNEAFFLGWQGALSVGGASDLNLLSMSLDMKRTVTPRWAARNSQSAQYIFPAPLAVTGKMTFDIPDDTEYNRFINDTREQHIITLTQAPNAGVAIANSPTGATEVGNVVTILTTTPHGFAKGQHIVVAGVGVSGYNGVWPVASVPDSTHFTYLNPTLSLAASGGGTASGGGSLAFQMSKLVYLTAVKTAQQDWLQAEMTFQAVYNPIDAGPILITAGNGQTAAY